MSSPTSSQTGGSLGVFAQTELLVARDWFRWPSQDQEQRPNLPWRCRLMLPSKWRNISRPLYLQLRGDLVDWLNLFRLGAFVDRFTCISIHDVNVTCSLEVPLWAFRLNSLAFCHSLAWESDLQEPIALYLQIHILYIIYIIHNYTRMLHRRQHTWLSLFVPFCILRSSFTRFPRRRVQWHLSWLA